MKIKKLDLNKHDIDKVSKLIYETELELFKPLFGKNQQKAQYNIKKLIINGENSFGHDFINVVTLDNDEVLGVLVSYSGRELKENNETRTLFKALGFIEFLKLTLIGSILNKLLTSEKNDDDYYLSNISVDENHRGKGVGTFILKYALKLANEKNARRVILDVSLDNIGARKLYEKTGFKIYNKKSIKWFGEEIGSFNMEYTL